MADFGFGFGSHSNNFRYAGEGRGSPVPLLLPSAQWSGAPGSGFGTTPADPVRTSAKPALRLIVPPNQFYSDELLVGVMAGANDNGSLRENLGLKRVIVHYEGTSRIIDAPSFQTFADANGTYRTYFGWWALLRNDGRSGHARLYFEAVPSNGAMQARVIGPYQFSPQPKLHDGSFTVARSGGGDFASIGEALAHCRDNSLQNPLVTITEAGNYDISGSGPVYVGAGYCTVAAAVAGVCIAKPGYTTDAEAALRSRYGALRFKGANLSIDMRFISEIHTESGSSRSHWLDGCMIVNSAGQGALWRGGLRPAAHIAQGGWFTECMVQNCSDAFVDAQLVRGATAVNGTGQLYSGCPAIVNSVTVAQRSDLSLARDVPAVRVHYTGSASSATIELTGAAHLPSRTLRVKIAGEADRTFVLEKSEAAYQADNNYTLAHLIAWLNTIPGLSVANHDNSSGRGAGWLSLKGLAGEGFAARDIKAAPLTLFTHVAVRDSWWEAGELSENAVLWGNLAIGIVGRAFDLRGEGAKRDMLFANNAVQNDSSAEQSAWLQSEFDGPHSHVAFVHNTLSSQHLSLRTDAAYASGFGNLLANNSVVGIGWGGAAGTTPIVCNHLHGGQVAPPSAAGLANVSGTSIGGDEATLYGDVKAGDFNAKGELLDNPAPAVLRHNGVGDQFAAMDAKGCKVGPCAPTAMPTPTPGPPPATLATSVSQQGITFNFGEPRPVAQYANGDWAVQGPVTITSIAPISTIISGQFADGHAYSGREVHGAMLNPGNRSHAPGGLVSNNTGSRPHGQSTLPQGYDSLGRSDGANGSTSAPYAGAQNVDPGKTKEPLQVTTGSVVKVISRPTPPRTGRILLSDMVVLTVVEELPSSGALRPGVAAGDKTSPFNEADFDLGVFNNFPRPASAPSVAQLLAKIGRKHEVEWPDSLNTRNIHAVNNQSEYGREITNDISSAMLCLHLDYSEADKRAILRGLVTMAIDVWARAVEGGIRPGWGGGNQGPLLALALARIVLRNSPNTEALASMSSYIDYAQRRVFSEHIQLVQITRQHVITPRNSGDGRERHAFAQWMTGSHDFAEGHTNIDAGSNWDTMPYRTVWGNPLVGGALAVHMLPGGRALWNREPFFNYMLNTAWNRERQRVGADTNSIIPFAGDMMAAHRPTSVAPPAVVDAGILSDSDAGETSLWLRFDKALDEFNLTPPVSAFTVRVNNSPVAISAVEGVWRDNVGLRLANPVRSVDVVTVSYTPGANPLRSAVDEINVQAMSDHPVTNITPSVGGKNASYPIVRFTASNPDRYGSSGRVGLGPDHPRGTLWIPHIRIFDAPPNLVEIFGQAGGTPTFELQLLIDRRLKLLVRDAAGTLRAQLTSGALAANTAYNVRFDWDFTDASTDSGCNIFLNGSSSKNQIVWSGGPGQTVGWSRAAPYRLGGTVSPHFDGELGGFWLHTSERVTDPSQVAKLSSTRDGSLEIGTLGDGVTGTLPTLFFVGNAEQFNSSNGINRGSGPKFFRIQGGVTDVAGSQWM